MNTSNYPQILNRFYEQLLAEFGPQHWWPGETPFEVIVGAVLVQNTNWKNVERAIDNLRESDLLDPHARKPTVVVDRHLDAGLGPVVDPVDPRDQLRRKPGRTAKKGA